MRRAWFIYSMLFAETGNAVKYQTEKVSVQAVKPNSVCMSTDLAGLPGKVKVLTNCFWLHITYWNTIHYTTDKNIMLSMFYTVCSFFEKTGTMSLEYLKTTYILEVGFNKGSKLTPNYSTSNSAFKVKISYFFAIPEVPESEVKLILWDMLMPKCQSQFWKNNFYSYWKFGPWTQQKTGMQSEHFLPPWLVCSAQCIIWQHLFEVLLLRSFLSSHLFPWILSRCNI